MFTPNQGIPEFIPIRSKVLNSVLLYMSFGALPLLASSLFLFYTSGWKWSMLIDIVGLLSIPVVYLMRNKINYNIRLTYMILLGLFSGIMIFKDYSILGTGIIVLSSVTLISTLFFGMRTGWLMMIFDTILVVVIGFLYHHNYLEYNFNFDAYIYSPLTWFDHVVTFLFFIGIVAIASGQIHSAMLDLFRQTRTEKEKFKGLFNNIQDAIMIYSRDGRILEMNNSLLDMYGIGRSSVFDTKAEDFSIFIQNAFLESNINYNSKQQYETKARRFDDHQEFFIEVMLSPIEYGEEKAILANIRNINQRRQAEEALRQSEEKYRSLIESSPAGIFIIESGQFRYINPAGISNLGYKSIDDIADRDIYSFLDPGFRNDAEQTLEMVVNKEVNHPVELKYLRADGAEVWAETILIPYEYYGTKAVLIMGFDITERKKAEELILQKNKEIENRNLEYALLNEQLKVAKEKAEESDRLKSAFLSNMSHEIRTPMNAILGFSDLLIRASLTEQKRREYVEIINSSGIQLLSLINDIIDISKIESNQIVIDKTSQVNLNDIFKHLSVIYHAKAKSRNILLQSNVKLNYPQTIVYLDEIRLKQILVNLIGNAIKFTNDGYVRFNVSLEKNELLFTVEDSGIGIHPDQQAVIFERFRQADGSTTRDYGGTGLGLAISKALVEMMGGKIGVSSIPGQGTTFYFTLPFRSTDTSIQLNGLAYQDIQENFDWNDKSILIVEDEEVNILFLSELLKSTGVSILIARNANDAYKEIHSATKIDLVLLDIKIPKVDGYEIVKVIKTYCPQLPVIAQTAYALSEERKTILQSGFDDYISKPINRGILFNMISRYF